ncbi:MAG: molybdopterin dinucleotide-binding protein [Candidatus Thorarchaeota archaeon]|nr:molybdopterin dinucleotide-binding protein [Candidatus Thorarchaeota archaeon]
MTMAEIAVVLTTGRTLAQGRALETGKQSVEYIESTAVCEMDASSISALGISPGEPVLVRTDAGSAVLRSAVDRRARPGVIFVPTGPYANLLIGGLTGCSGMPTFKGVAARVSAAPGQSVMGVSELLGKLLGE